MIRVNLLAVERAKVKRRPGIGQKLNLLFSLVLVATGVALAWWYWSLNQRSAQLDRDIQAAQQETIRLRAIIAQVNDFDTQKKLLEQRVSLIETLKKGQVGPVYLLDQVSRALPDLLWLTSMVQEGQNVTIEGSAMSLMALSDFVANLEGSGYFKPPVEIVDSKVESRQEGDIVRFTIRVAFAPPPPKG